MLRRSAYLPLFAVTIVAVDSNAQTASQIPIRSLTPAISTDSGVVANVYMLRGLSNGSVILNDAAFKRLVIFDSTLKKYKVLADTSGTAPNRFGLGNGGLVFFPGDSSAFIDSESRALVVVSPTGEFKGITTLPTSSDFATVSLVGGGTVGVPGFDTKGLLYYRGTPRRPAIPRPTAERPETTYIAIDSAPLLRANLDTRKIDTIAMLRIPLQKSRYIAAPTSMQMSSVINPLPTTDEWAYFPDGTVAVVRGHDYHIDWIYPDGTRKSTLKMQFDWRRVTDEDKQKMVDSVIRLYDSLYKARIAAGPSDAASGRAGAGGSGGRGGGGTAPPGVAGAPFVPPPFRPPEVVKLEEMPDYYPSVRSGTPVRVDPDGNLWVVPATSLQAKGGLLFDVINREGQIIERVQLPAGRNLHGFGPGGVVYMSVPAVLQKQFGFARVERARIIR